MSIVANVGQACFYVALVFGLFFFIFACKYYISILIVLFNSRSNRRYNNCNNVINVASNWRNGFFENHPHNWTGNGNYFNTSIDENDYLEEPFVSIQLPFYNERNVAKRIIQACGELDYANYEVIVVDDSSDETVDIFKELNGMKGSPTLKFVHRKDRAGFKGGALQKAMDYMDPRTEYILVLDADFIPPNDIIRRFLWYFDSLNGTSDHENNSEIKFKDQSANQFKIGKSGDNNSDVSKRMNGSNDRRRIAVVQGYQLHNLNKNENWITRGVRAEFSGSYMIERSAEEFFGAMKMIAGSVFMIRADVLKKLGWTDSITEDWDLTLRMYQAGYKVLYTPLIFASAEIPNTIRILTRQRMRWAEGHTFAVKKYFWDILKSPNLNVREKLEFLYFTPYYLQSFFMLTGTLFWVIAELLGQLPPFWTPTFGWCLVITNLSALPLMSLTGLYLEQTTREDFTSIFSFVALSYILAPFQAYAALKGLMERDEGCWVRTLKTGNVTNNVFKIWALKDLSRYYPRLKRRIRPQSRREKAP